MSTIKASAIREILKTTSNPGIISFAGGNPASEAFPVEQIKKISNELLENEPTRILQYGISEGDNDLLTIANEFFNRNEVVTKANDGLIITSGSQQIMEFAVKCLCNDGDTVISEDPSFIGALNAFKSQGVKVLGVGRKNNQLDINELETLLQRKPKPKFMYLIPNFQNPTGITMNLETRKKVLALAKKYEVLILEDNPYGDLRFNEEHIPSIKSLDNEGVVIYAASLSKIIAPGMRIALAIAPKPIIDKFVIAKQVSDIHSSLWSQRVMAKFLQDYDIDEHIRGLRKLYKHKCDLMIGEMEKYFHPSVKYIKPTGGMFIWVTLPESMEVMSFINEALKRGVAVVPGSAFSIDDTATTHNIRLNFSTPSDQDIVKGIQILGKLTYEMK
jgi:2-aminoadipate transaminase